MCLDWVSHHVCGCTRKFRVNSEEGKGRGAGPGACVRPAFLSPWGRERLWPLPGPVSSLSSCSSCRRPTRALVKLQILTGVWRGQVPSLQTTRGARLSSTGTEPPAPCGALCGQSGKRRDLPGRIWSRRPAGVQCGPAGGLMTENR